jgi:hypothetical protein
MDFWSKLVFERKCILLDRRMFLGVCCVLSLLPFYIVFCFYCMGLVGHEFLLFITR